MKKMIFALALSAVAFQASAAEAVKPVGLATKVVPILVTTAVVGGAIAAANNSGSHSSGTTGTTP